MNFSALTLVNPTYLILFIGVGLFAILAVFAGLAVLIVWLNYQENPVKERLWQLKHAKSSADDQPMESQFFEEITQPIARFAEPVAETMYSQNHKYKKSIKTLLNEAGLIDDEEAVNRFLIQRATAGIIAAFICGVTGLIISQGNVLWMASGGIGGFLGGSLLPQIGLRRKAVHRKGEIRFKLSDTLDLMTVCMEAGLGLDATIYRVAQETAQMAPEISHEFRRLNKELNAGISRLEAFQNLGQRAGVDEMRSLCAMIIQSDKMGTSVADTLRIFADDLRTKRRQKAEELASKASIKMTFPLVLFIFPPLFIVLMGPTVIMAIQHFGGGE